MEEIIDAVKRDVHLLNKLPIEIRSNIEFAFKIINVNPDFVGSLSNELKANRDIALFTVAKEGYTLRWFSREIQDDYDVVMKAVQDNGLAFRYASKRLRSNIDILKEALKTEGDILNYASMNLRMNKDVISYMLDLGYYDSFQDIHPILYHDKNYVLQVIQDHPKLIMYFPDKYRSDRDIIRICVSKDRSLIEYAIEDLTE